MRSPSRIAAPSHQLFLTPKSSHAIPIAGPLAYDALRQAALDPAVEAIEYVGKVPVGGRNYHLGGILVVRDGTRYVLDIYDGKNLRSIDEEGLRLLAIDQIGATPFALPRSRILCEPRCSSARLIWEHRRRPVGMHARSRILEDLDRGGPSSLRTMRARREDVFALACEALVDIDLGEALDEAIVRRSTRAVPVRPSFIR